MGGRPIARTCSVVVCVWGLIVAAPAGGARLQGPVAGGGRAIKLVPKETPVGRDVVRFGNGDALQGEIWRIVDGAVTLKPDMAEDSLTVSVDALKDVVFRDSEARHSISGDRVMLVNGEALRGPVRSMANGKVLLDGHVAGDVELKQENVAAISFFREEEVLAEESFDDGLPATVRFEGGTWATQGGWLLQRDSRAVECYASLPVTQTGEVCYEWTLNTTIGRSTGVYFMASDPGLWQDAAYFVRILRNYVYVYFCRNGEEVYCGSYRISLYRSKNDVRLRCDSDRGRFQLWIDGTEVGCWECSVPIRTGKYVVLRADGRAAFEDLSIVRKAGAVRVDPSQLHAGEDVLKLVNGDEILGTVSGIQEGKVFFEGYGGEKPVGIARGKALYVRFGRNMGNLPRAMGGTVVLVMRDEERISGDFLSLEGGVARVRSDLAGVVELPAEELKKVIFKEFP